MLLFPLAVVCLGGAGRMAVTATLRGAGAGPNTATIEIAATIASAQARRAIPRSP